MWGGAGKLTGATLYPIDGVPQGWVPKGRRSASGEPSRTTGPS